MWISILLMTLDSFMWGSYPASLWNVGGSTQLPTFVWNNAWGTSEGLSIRSGVNTLRFAALWSWLFIYLKCIYNEHIYYNIFLQKFKEWPPINFFCAQPLLHFGQTFTETLSWNSTYCSWFEIHTFFYGIMILCNIYLLKIWFSLHCGVSCILKWHVFLYSTVNT